MNTMLSIITPVYNRADCLTGCLQSVSDQIDDLPGVEHVVIDDGSADGSYDVALAYAASYPHVKVGRMAVNRGTNAARNAAVRMATGKYILLLDSDDALAPGSLKIISDTIAANGGTRHFMFAADDRAEYYDSIGAAPHTQTAFTFRQFLENKVGGDFAHVILRDTMLKYPFIEKIRIFENTVFLSFYKEAQKMLFTNTTVLLRDRGRHDRVMYSLVSDNRASVERSEQAYRILISGFYNDYIATPAGKDVLRSYLLKYYSYVTLLGMRTDARRCEEALEKLGASVPRLYKTLNASHCGPLFFSVARNYIKFKYKFLTRPQ